ncbi:MAG: hypothetical protein IPI31_18240 [Bacteroidetes bacterium]|nr:hypothetical protein [Bacteroidota bacterium]MBK7569764.1 hypothetical protein [Bacteroidota bacterium]MBP8917191.1 hypothetical protein [Chitinophagales bacterium]
MEIVSVSFSGITFSEPATSITDMVLAIICFSLVARIKNNFNESFFNNAWRLFFLFTGLATSLGTVCHGFELMLPTSIHNMLWMCMNICSSISVYFALKATIRFTRAEDFAHRLLQVLNIGSLVVFSGLTIVNNDFEIFKIHCAIGLTLIFITHAFASYKSHVGSGSIVLGMLLSFITVYIHTNQISINAWFDYKDIGHVIMMFSLVLIYNGIYLMKENLKLSVYRLRFQ